MKLIALGSNLPSTFGSPIDNLHKAAKLLETNGFRIFARGDIYESAPVPVSDQPNFYNSILQVEYRGTPEAALAACLKVEAEMGRVRSEKNEARIIDIDVIAWDNLVQQNDPILPHPRMHERSFVLYPLVDIAPEWIHPLIQRNAAELKVALGSVDIHEAAEQW